jgi:glucose/mannose-6-phosphate isomerase
MTFGLMEPQPSSFEEAPDDGSDRRLPATLTREILEQCDPSGLWHRLVEFPEQAAYAWQLGCTWPGIVSATSVRRVVIIGMGGSSIGAQLAASLVRQCSPVAVDVVQDARLPVMDEHTLLIAASFSGETEEVLTALRASADQPCMKLVITRGGTLARDAAALNIHIVRYQYEGEPRHALGYGMLLLLGIFQQLGIFPVSDAEVAGALAEVTAASAAYYPDVPLGHNPARSLALQLEASIPMILADAPLATAAIRWRNQCNENSKRWAFTGVLPEALHNIVEGMQFGRSPGVAGGMPFHLILLEDHSRPAAARVRLDVLQDLLSETGISWTRLAFDGSSELSILLQACVIGDWVSYYLALGSGIDPSPVPTISRLKRQIAQRAAASADASA